MRRAWIGVLLLAACGQDVPPPARPGVQDTTPKVKPSRDWSKFVTMDDLKAMGGTTDDPRIKDPSQLIVYEEAEGSHKWDLGISELELKVWELAKESDAQNKLNELAQGDQGMISAMMAKGTAKNGEAGMMAGLGEKCSVRRHIFAKDSRAVVAMTVLQGKIVFRMIRSDAVAKAEDLAEVEKLCRRAAEVVLKKL
jgi:hypothetical protein